MLIWGTMQVTCWKQDFYGKSRLLLGSETKLFGHVHIKQGNVEKIND